MRAGGEGTISRRKNGLWATALMLPSGNRQWFCAKTQMVALRTQHIVSVSLDSEWLDTARSVGVELEAP